MLPEGSRRAGGITSMTFCMSGRRALFTLGFRTQIGGGGGDDMVTEGLGGSGNGSVIV